MRSDTCWTLAAAWLHDTPALALGATRQGLLRARTRDATAAAQASECAASSLRLRC